MALLYEDITSEIIGAAFDVHSELSYAFLEIVYQKAMLVELAHRGLKAQLECPIVVKFKGVIVGEYQADILVEDKIIVELKIAKLYRAEDEAQLLNELKATGLRVGLLLNFGKQSVEFKRLVM